MARLGVCPGACSPAQAAPTAARTDPSTSSHFPPAGPVCPPPPLAQMDCGVPVGVVSSDGAADSSQGGRRFLLDSTSSSEQHYEDCSVKARRDRTTSGAHPPLSNSVPRVTDSNPCVIMKEAPPAHSPRAVERHLAHLLAHRRRLPRVRRLAPNPDPREVQHPGGGRGGLPVLVRFSCSAGRRVGGGVAAADCGGIVPTRTLFPAPHAGSAARSARCARRRAPSRTRTWRTGAAALRTRGARRPASKSRPLNAARAPTA